MSYFHNLKTNTFIKTQREVYSHCETMEAALAQPGLGSVCCQGCPWAPPLSLSHSQSCWLLAGQLVRGLWVHSLQGLLVWARNALGLWVSPVLIPSYFYSYKMTERNTASDFSGERKSSK